MLTRALLLSGVVCAVAAPCLEAQVRLRSEETRRLREAANRESMGDLEGAERILLGVLDDDPASSGALFALERVLRAQGEVAEILPPVDAFLEREPASSGVRYLKLRVLHEIDSLGALRREAERWLADDPSSEVPYREVSRVYERAFGPDEALAVLRRGRDAVGGEAALALDIGDVLASTGDVEGGVDEWARAVSGDGGQISVVVRRVQRLDTGATEAAARLVAALEASADVERRRTAARAALDLGLEEPAMRLTRHVAARLEGRARESFLADAARRAREQELVEVAAWAYDQLGAGASSPAERRQFDQRIIDAALAMGDTATAIQAQHRLVESFSPGSVDRRRAAAAVLTMEAASADPERLRALLGDFSTEYPDAPELDGLAAAVSRGLGARGDVVGAEEVLAGVEGPRSALERGFLMLEDGRIDEGRDALLLAVSALPPVEATPVIQFVSLLSRLAPASKELLAEAGVVAHRGRAAEAAAALGEEAGGVPAADVAALLAEAARMAADGGDAELAARLNERLVSEHADAAEVGPAALALARHRARTPAGVDEAIRILEDLITQSPNAAVVPAARVELDRLRGRGGGR